MATSTEDIDEGRLGPDMSVQVKARLYMDLDACSSGACDLCEALCSYYYHPGNDGVASLIEAATYYLVCRRCEEPHCVNACPHEALEQKGDADKLLIRHNMRCVSCKSCSHACPYGTIYPEHVPLIAHNCDFCLDRRDQPDEPLCVATCPHGALCIVRDDEIIPDGHTFLVGEHLIVHSTHWQRDKA